MSVAKKSFVTGKLLVARECCISAIIPLRRNETRLLSADRQYRKLLRQNIDQPIYSRSKQSTGRDRNQPGGDDLLRHAPADLADALSRTYADDRRTDHL